MYKLNLFSWFDFGLVRRFSVLLQLPQKTYAEFKSAQNRLENNTNILLMTLIRDTLITVSGQILRVELLPDHESAVANRVHHRQADRRRVARQLRPLRWTEIRMPGEVPLLRSEPKSNHLNQGCRHLSHVATLRC